MAGKVYPEWVQAQKRKGTTIKKVGDNYYLYKHSSKRVPGKKYPVPLCARHTGHSGSDWAYKASTTPHAPQVKNCK